MDKKLKELLVPISKKDPVGTSLKYDDVYDKIKEARREDDPTIPRLKWEGGHKVANWDSVEELCINSLKKKTKDLQISVWLAEAWYNINGFSGLAMGIELNRLLIDKFWNDLYPKIEEDDLSYRLAPLEWLNVKLTEKIRLHPISAPKMEDTKQYTLYHWLLASRAVGREVTELDKDQVYYSEIKESQSFTPSVFYIDLKKETLKVLNAIKSFHNSLTGRCKEGENIFYKLRRVTRKVNSIANTVLGERNEQNSIDVIKEYEDEDMTKETKVSSSGKIVSRADAYRRLAEVADYLVKIEPHSPTPYLIKRAIAWGNMSLSELMQEIIQDRDGLGRVMNLLGMNKDMSSKHKTPNRTFHK